MGLNQKKIKIFPIKSGHFWADAGSVMGILPKSLWQDKIQTDPENRVRLDLNQLLIQTAGLNILVDTGLNKQPSTQIPARFKFQTESIANELKKYQLLPSDIDIVILTHLHYDHAGGIYNENGELKFNQAVHYVQRKEWLAATKKDIVDAVSYKTDLSGLEISGRLKLIDGDYQLTPEIKLKLVGGHTEGLQIVRIEKNRNLVYFGSDLFPLFPHKTPQVTAAADICRQQVFLAKKQILSELKNQGGLLYFGHQTGKNYLEF